MKKEKSCGIIVFHQQEILLVHHNLGHWGIPKGHVEDGETEEETALREVFEETGVAATVIDSWKEKITYSPKENISKDVIFFLGKAVEDHPVPQQSEVQEAEFLPIKEALSKITHEDERNILEKAIDRYQNLK